MKINTQEYRPDIDGLRAIAVTLVLVFHAFPQLITGGFVGVDVFFVISGYLITKIISGDIARDRFSFRRFYEKRILRIFPALILVLLSCLAAGYYTLLAREYKALGKHVLGGATYISNFLLMKEAGYFDSSSELKALLHLWSLAIEEQFYLVWPVVLVLGATTRRHALKVIGTLALLSFGLCLYFTRQYPENVFFNPLTRAWELFVGAFLSFLPPLAATASARTPASAGSLGKFGISRFTAPNVLSLCGLLLIAVSSLVFGGMDLFPYWRALLPCAGASLIILAGKDAAINRRLLGARPVVYIGLISYPLYLWHWPALFFARMISNNQLDPVITGAAVLFSLLAAAATYHLVEKRIRHSTARYVPLVLLLTLLGLGAAGGLVYRLKGLPERFPVLEQRAKNVGSFEWYEQGYDNTAACIQLLDNKFPDYCNIMDLKRPATIALLGDSTANHYFLGLADELTGKSSKENLVEIGKSSCPPLLDIESFTNTGPQACDETMSDMLEYVDHAPSIHTVILSMTGATYFNETRAAAMSSAEYFRVRLQSNPKLDDPEQIFATAIRKTLVHLQRTRKQVIFLLSVPALDFYPEDCENIRPFSIKGSKKSSCDVDRGTIDRINADYRNLVIKVLKEFPQVKLWDPYGSICDDKVCHTLQDGLLLYRDKIHLGFYGSQFIGERLPVVDLIGDKTSP